MWGQVMMGLIKHPADTTSDPYFTQGVVFRSGIKKTKTALKIKKLERKKYYWVHVRTYKWVGNTKYVSSWSKSKKVKTK